MSPLAMAEWIEIRERAGLIQRSSSPLAMAEWIEMTLLSANTQRKRVSASDGGVD